VRAALGGAHEPGEPADDACPAVHRPGHPEIRDAVDGASEFSRAGRKRLKGFSEPVRAYRAKRQA
jgi:hypothetical protein